MVDGPPDEQAGVGTTAVGAWLDALLMEVPDALRGRRTVLSGPDIVAALCAHSAVYGAIAVGTHHRTATGRLFMGSVAEGLMRHATVPVLVMPPGGSPVDAGRAPRVRVPVDILRPNLDGLAWVSDNLPDASAAVVYALPWATVMGAGPTPGHHIYEKADVRLAEVLGGGGRGDVPRFILVREEMNAGDALAQDALDADIDLTVIPTRGRTGLMRLVMGSVTERVVRASQRDVLVLR